jgi:hypothetical protein
MGIAKFLNMACDTDNCGNKFVSSQGIDSDNPLKGIDLKLSTTIDEAKAAGWTRINGNDYCPHCSKASFANPRSFRSNF